MLDLDRIELSDARKAFLEERKKGIGSTMSPTILGLSRFTSPFALWQELTGQADDRPQTLPMWLGLKMQSVVGELYAHANGKRLRADNRMHVHPGHPWLYTHLDFRVIGERRLVEAKTSNRWDLWGADGSTDVPPEYWVQVQHEMAVTGYQWCDLAVLLSNREFRTFPIPADPEFQARMIDADHEFWFDHVLTGDPPYDGSEAAEAFLRRTKPTPTAGMKVASAEQTLQVVRWEELGAEVKRLKAEQAKIQQVLELGIGDAEGIYGPGFEASWRQNKPTTTHEWELVASTFGALLRQLAEARNIREVRKLLATTDPDTVVSLYTDVKPGARVFRVSRKKQRD